MWVFVVIVGLLHQNQAAPTTGGYGGPHLILLQQLDQTTPSPSTHMTQQRTSSSSSSSSSSSVSSESSQSSEEPQQVREQQNLENTAVEQVDSSEESSEVLQSPSNSSTSLWLSELVLLGERMGEQDRERDTGDDVESRLRVLALTFHPLLSGASEPSLTMTRGGGASLAMGGAIRAETDADFPQLLDDSEEDGQTYAHAHHHGYHGDEAEMELGL